MWTKLVRRRTALKAFNIHEAKTHFSRLVDEAASGKEIVIAKAGRPVAKLVSIDVVTGKEKREPRKLGILDGKMSVPDDFDAPLPDDVLALFYEGRLFPEPPEDK
jgi:prevent-host-death family protein